MLQQTSWGADQDVALIHSRSLEFQILAANDEARGEVMMLAHFLKSLEDLVGQLPSGRYDDGTHTICAGPFVDVEMFQHLARQ